MNPGIYYTVANKDYHASKGVSSTALKQFMRSPAHYRAYMDGQKKNTPALDFGKLIHMALLEPDKYATAVAIGPDCAKSTKAWKEFATLHKGFELIKPAEAQQITAMVEAVHANKAAHSLLEHGSGFAEASAYWFDPKSGELAKCRPDWWRNDGILVDYKSTIDASPTGFIKAVSNYNYHLSAGFYLEGCSQAIKQSKADMIFPTSFVFIAQEKEPPYAVGVYLADADMIYTGKALAEELLLRLSDCKCLKSWPAYPDKITEISLPSWANKEAI